MENEIPVERPRRLGRLPRKSTRKALLFSDFFKFVDIPESTSYWKAKKPLPLRNYGNLQYGDCTRAKQAVAITRMERIEQRRLVNITDQEVIDRYLEMSQRRYGGGDNGAYEVDALDDWRNPETTIRDVDGKPYTIDAYLSLNPANQKEIKAALALAGAHGLPFCMNLPLAYASTEPPAPWDVPHAGQPLIGDWMPGSWGGHSMWMHELTKAGPITDHTWELPPQVITWEAIAAYCDEIHIVIDSIDAWRKRAATPAIKKALGNVVDAVNAVSSLPIKLP